jgi:predicted GNAT superfamily acetyltransferase
LSGGASIPEPEFADVTVFDASRPHVDRAKIMIPVDIDQIVQTDRAAALEWRLRLRRDLQTAFGAGLAITGFAANVDPDRGLSAYLVERTSFEEEES